MKTPLTYGAYRILHDLFKNGVTFKRALHREKLLELKERGYVATYANNFVYLTPTGQQYAIESFWGEHSNVWQVVTHAAQISNAGMSITKLASDLPEANSDMTNRRFSSVGILTSGPVLELSDSAQDVLYALFFRGALVSGDIPSKAGASALRSLGFAETGHTATPYKGEDYFTWLTPAGYAFAIGHLVKTRFGKQPANRQLHPEGLSIKKAMIKGTISSAAHVCGNTIEQETLSKVLANSLHNVSHEKAGDVAEQLARAVKSAFSALGHASSEQDKERPKESNLSVGTFKVYNEGKVKMASGSPLTAEIEAKREDRKIAGTINLKLELDTSDAIESINGLSKEISDLVDTAIANSLEPGGRLHGSMRGNDDLVADVVSLRTQVAKLDSAFQNVCLSIADLNNRMAARITGDVHASPV
ncbi:TPA: hypothetical protein MCM71_004541 [Klebsiella pneumoniae]|uniref:hypothetical protein n=1 Tax=Klebsiella variicola TaxID=244366 RepID=UPI0018C6C1B4|nr:hypothetical protein [Klebsiella variicola]UMD20982.1 hypothetical protein JJ681_26505 [Klebsiella pneumoniae]MBG2046980.1 hypothetical protein [Klebsiella variicola]UME45003.1 hypothetical protein JJ516_27745 [Klebsiella pneumoniae]HBT9189155.1 hypothetical protein [Klebsiella pneumoniae]HBT9217018.1 hypothetical protein [Klebsiella pneumoniae]